MLYVVLIYIFGFLIPLYILVDARRRNVSAYKILVYFISILLLLLFSFLFFRFEYYKLTLLFFFFPYFISAGYFASRPLKANEVRRGGFNHNWYKYTTYLLISVVTFFVLLFLLIYAMEISQGREEIQTFNREGLVLIITVPLLTIFTMWGFSIYTKDPSIEETSKYLVEKKTDSSFIENVSVSNIKSDKSKLYSKQFSELSNKLNRFSELEDGWDSYNAEPPNRKAIANLKKALFVTRRLELLPSDVCPSVEGGTGIYFAENNKYADIEFFNSGEILVGLSNKIDKPRVKEIRINEIDETLNEIIEFLNA